MTIPTENQEAETLATRLKNNNYKSTHIANESGLPPRVAMIAAKRKKRMGLSPGFPDFCIILKRGALLFIELKRQIDYSKSKKGKKISVTSEEQKEWLKSLNMIQNIQAEICYGAEESIKLIEKIEIAE